jgi:hypothetical protein
MMPRTVRFTVRFAGRIRRIAFSRESPAPGTDLDADTADRLVDPGQILELEHQPVGAFLKI